MGFVKTHQPCEDCGSSDALAINEDGSTRCFSCNAFSAGSNVSDNVIDMTVNEESYSPAQGRHEAIPSRGISAATTKKFNVVTRGLDLVFHYHAIDGDGPIAAKTKTPNKDFRTSGDWKRAGLFGQNLFPGGGRYITIVEGEMDALAAYQMQGAKSNVVSIKNGASNAVKDCVASYEFLNSYENIIISFDADPQGRAAAVEVAQLFSGKAKIMKHAEGMKDANDYLIANRGAEFVDRFWKAELYKPDGIISGDSLWDVVSNELEEADLNYPFQDLNKITYGIRKGELVTVTAGSGLGKSQFVREIVYHAIKNTDDNIGLMFMEEGVRKTGLSLMSLHANKPMHLPGVQTTEAEKKEAYDATIGTGRVHLYSHFGSNAIDNILARVRFMVKGLGCKYIFLDHISIIVSAQEQDDERKAIDQIMTKLRMFVEETGIALFVVSHLRRPQGAGHEDGASTSLSQLRGSAAIAQLSDMVIGLERNGQDDDPLERNTTSLRVLKNRFSGETGPAGKLLYDKDTGRMVDREIVDLIPF